MMKQKYIVHNPDHKRLILLFTGWSTDAGIFKHLSFEGWDILVCWGYDSLEFDTRCLEGYHTIYLFAWSLGVAAADACLKGVDFTMSIAVNGTLKPVDDALGIPTDIYMKTHDGLDTSNLRRFRRRVVPDNQAREEFLALLEEHDDIDRLKRELLYIKELSDKYQDGERGVAWSRAYVADNDRIFPAANQLHAWHDKTEIIRVKGDHYMDMNKLLSACIPDTVKTGDRFHKAAYTYDTQAIAQRSIANRLVELIAEAGVAHGGTILEIGPGTGIFTRIYSPVILPEKAFFIDLYPLDNFGIAPQEHYVVADAETVMSDNRFEHVKFDYVLSSSTIQWFAHQRLFFRNVSRHLKPEGTFAFSTFLPGNLQELDELRPVPLIYRSKERLREMLEESFADVVMYSEKIVMDFATAKELVLHLKQTGVGGNGNHTDTIYKILNGLKPNAEGRYPLTYHPLYVVARGPKA